MSNLIIIMKEISLESGDSKVTAFIVNNESEVKDFIEHYVGTDYSIVKKNHLSYTEYNATFSNVAYSFLIIPETKRYNS